MEVLAATHSYKLPLADKESVAGQIVHAGDEKRSVTSLSTSISPRVSTVDYGG